MLSNSYERREKGSPDWLPCQGEPQVRARTPCEGGSQKLGELSRGRARVARRAEAQGGQAAVNTSEQSGVIASSASVPQSLSCGTGITEMCLISLAIPAGLEPATLCLEGRCSIQLSYGTSAETMLCLARRGLTLK